jgi:hypothetical protein
MLQHISSPLRRPLLSFGTITYVQSTFRTYAAGRLTDLGNSEMATLESHLAPAKLVFYFLFWGLHWGLFAYGWCVQQQIYTDQQLTSVQDKAS